MLIDQPQQGGGLLDSLGSLAGGIGRGISSGAGAVAEGLGGLMGGGGMGPFFNPTPDIGPIFDGGFSLPDFDFGGGGGGGGPFYNPTPELPTGLLDFDMPGLDNPWLM